jgi:mRNA-degrading endonuclease toxin of MazEF toxin-antitoxin module
MRRGDIWFIDFPDDKVRPGVIMTRDQSIDGLIRLVVVPVTTRQRGLDIEVELAPPASPLPRLSYCKCDELYTLDKTHFVDFVGHLDTDDLNAVAEAVSLALDLAY